MGCFPKSGSAIKLNHHENSKADMFLEFITLREVHHCHPSTLVPLSRNKIVAPTS